MNSKSFMRSVGFIGLVVFGASALHGKPVKADSERYRSVAEQAKGIMANDKKLHDSVVAAIKAKDTAKVQSLFAKAGLSLPEMRISSTQCCVFLPPFGEQGHGPSGPMICCN